VEDSATTASNISSNESLFRLGIFGFIIVIICDILVSWSLYVLLKPVNHSLSLLMGWWRLVYSTIFAVALVNYLDILHLLGESGLSASMDTAQLSTKVKLSVKAFSDLWTIGFIFFGLHLTFLGYLVSKAGYIPKIIGILVLIAGISYLIDYSVKVLFPDSSPDVSLYAGWFELILMLWLLIKGNKVSEQQKT